MTGRAWRFGNGRIDLAARELYRDGSRIAVSPKVFDCIAYLIEHSDRAIGRDELAAAVWGKADVTDTMLGQIVLKARRAVGDTGEEQAAIRTIARFGYRWTAPVESEDSLESNPSSVVEPTDHTTPGAESPRQSRIPYAWIGIAAILACLAGGAWWFSGNREDTRATTTPRNSAADTTDAIAVLPVDVAAGTDTAWVRLGVMDLIADRLQTAGLRVVPSDNIVAVMRDTASADKARAVREATGAAELVSAKAMRDARGWTVHLSWQSNAGGRREVDAGNPDLIVAARSSVDALLRDLGHAPPHDRDGAAPSAAEIVAQTKAALLVDDLKRASEVLDSADASMQPLAELRLLRAQIDFRAGRFDDARKRLTEMLADVPAETSPVLRARVLDTLGATIARIDDASIARKAYIEAIGLLENHNEPAELGRAYSGRGVTFAMDGRFDEASADFAQARMALQLGADSLALALVESNEGILEIRRNHHALALPILARAAARLKDMNSPSGLAIAAGEIAEAHLALLDPAKALAGAEETLALLNDQNTPPKHLLEYKRAVALAGVGRLADARRATEDLLRRIDAVQERPLLGQLHLQAAELELASQKPDSALTLARQAIDELSSHDYVRERSRAFQIVARVQLASGRAHDAADTARDLSAWSASANDPILTLYSLVTEAELARASEQRDLARKHYQDAVHVALREGVPIDIRAVATSYGDFLLGAADLAQAGIVIGRLAPWTGSDFACALMQVRLYHALAQREAWQTALAQARALAGERSIPAALEAPPGNLLNGTVSSAPERR